MVTWFLPMGKEDVVDTWQYGVADTPMWTVPAAIIGYRGASWKLCLVSFVDPRGPGVAFGTKRPGS